MVASRFRTSSLALGSTHRLRMSKRAVHRRLMQNERAKANVQKELGVLVGSNEKADELKARLDAWVQTFDQKSAVRTAKKEKRKASEAERVRNKKGLCLAKKDKRALMNGSRNGVSRSN